MAGWERLGRAVAGGESVGRAVAGKESVGLRWGVEGSPRPCSSCSRGPCSALYMLCKYLRGRKSHCETVHPCVRGVQ